MRRNGWAALVVLLAACGPSGPPVTPVLAAPDVEGLGAPDLPAACAGGDVARCFELAERMEAASRYEEMRDAFASAYDAGDVRGCCAYEFARLDTESGTTRGVHRACAAACEAGHAESCRALATAFVFDGDVQHAEDALAPYCSSATDVGCVWLLEVVTGFGTEIAEAKELFRQLCADGAPNACLALGRVLFESRGAAAEEPLRAACEAGYGEGCAYLAGILMDAGRTDEAEAAYRQGCDDLEDASGCAGWIFLLQGQGRSEEALGVAMSACERNPSWDCRELGPMLETAGRFDAALEFNLDRCERGEPVPCLIAGELLHYAGRDAESEGVNRRACELGHSLGCAWLGGATRGEVPEQGRRLDAEVLYRHYCETGSRRFCVETIRGVLEHEQLGPMVLPLVKSGCLDGNADSCWLLGEYYDVHEDDSDAAEAALRVACNASRAGACYHLAELLSAEGRDGDAEAPRRKACDLGFEEACPGYFLFGIDPPSGDGTR